MKRRDTRLRALALLFTVLAMLPAAERAFAAPATQAGPGAVAVAEVPAPAPQVADAVRRRLELMRAVAHAKFVAGEAIEDVAREQVVRTRLQARGLILGLAPDAVDAFAHALIEASKSIQRHWYSHWRAQGPPTARAPSLAGELRPQIDAVTDSLLIALALARRAPLNRAVASVLRQRLIVLAVEPLLIEALLQSIADMRAAEVDLEHSGLDRIQARGYLRVGVPGDYAPFAFPAAAVGATATVLTGIDIDLARKLASTLSVQLILVPTSWPTLMADLEADAFDLGLGGISRSLLRQRSALFSAPYFVDGKGAIARCTDAPQLQTLASIDRPDLRVLVNPGGTNEQFVRANIHHASVLVQTDNLGMFEALARGEGDVAFTDTAEIRWQVLKRPDLCQALRGTTLNRIDKAVLLPRDPILAAYIDLWLQELRASGELERIIHRYLP